MATWQTNTVGGLHPITQSIMSLAGAMFDPEIDRQRELRQSQIAVDNAQIGNYNANASKLASDTALNNQVLGARNNAANAFRLAAASGKVTPEHAALLYENLIQGGGASGGDVSQLGDTLGAIMLTVIWFRCLKGHFTPTNHFAFEGVAWYWHFVDVVWLLLFVVVYWL